MAIDPKSKSLKRLRTDAAAQIRQVLQPKLITRHIALLNGTKMRPITANSQAYMKVDLRIPKYAQIYALQDQMALVIARDYTDKKLNEFHRDAPCWSDDIYKYEAHARRFINNKANTKVLSKSEDEQGVVGKINPKFANPEEKLKPVRKAAGPKTKTRKSRAVRSPPPSSTEEDGASFAWLDELQAGHKRDGEQSNDSEEDDDSEGSEDEEEDEDEVGPARKKVKVQVEAVEQDEESKEIGGSQDMAGFFDENSF